MEESLEIKIQESFHRFGVPLGDRSIKIFGGVHPGYGVKTLCNKLFEQGAEAVLQERDPVKTDQLLVSAVFRSDSPTIK